MLGDLQIIELLLSYGADPLAERFFKIDNNELK
jgi:hypothetical protein